MTLILVSFLASADDSSFVPEKKFVEIEHFCVAHKKPRTVCGCVVKNIADKFKNGQFTELQVSDAAAVEKAAKDDNSRLDAMADLIAGLEYHCTENPNYSAD